MVMSPSGAMLRRTSSAQPMDVAKYCLVSFIAKERQQRRKVSEEVVFKVLAVDGWCNRRSRGRCDRPRYGRGHSAVVVAKSPARIRQK
jgi:hypothetical protein